MPKFLEKKLKKQYGAKSKIPYMIMNKMGAMHGSKITAKGRAMEKKHAMHGEPDADDMPHHKKKKKKHHGEYFPSVKLRGLGGERNGATPRKVEGKPSFAKAMNRSSGRGSSSVGRSGSRPSHGGY